MEIDDGRSADAAGHSAKPKPASSLGDTASVPNAMERSFEGLWCPLYCPRGETDCQSISQIISDSHASFMCVGENDGSSRELTQDRFRVCFKNSALDEQTDYDKRDLMQTQAVMAWALAVVGEREDCEQP